MVEYFRETVILCANNDSFVPRHNTKLQFPENHNYQPFAKYLTAKPAIR